jgi:hypothetical protein
VVKRQELVHVQAFIAQTAVEALYVAVFHRLSGMREVELYTPPPPGEDGLSTCYALTVWAILRR